jgi:S1-C subfamily serine protease
MGHAQPVARMRLDRVPRALYGVALLAVAALLLGAGCTDEDDAASGATTETSSAAPSRTPTSSGFERIPEIVVDVQPSVVSVVVTTQEGGAEGSGVIWDDQGHVVTNAHVVEGAGDVEVVLANGEGIPARLVASTADFDLAVLEVDRRGLPPADFAESLPAVGELALAVGNPLGFENTVTAGIVSGLHRSIPSGGQTRALVDLIQTDAPISPGNSGGALVGLDGRVIGINVAYLPPGATGAVSLGFAIPAPTVSSVGRQLVEDGRVELAYLGIRPVQITPAMAAQLGLDRDSGVAVVLVEPGSPAARAGLRAGDVLVGFAGRRVETVEDLFAGLRLRKPGQSVELTVVRDGETRRLGATLGSSPSGG